MSNLDIIRQKVKYHIRDIVAEPEDVDDVIDTVFREISVEIPWAEKNYGFQVFKDIRDYNFHMLAKLNEQAELVPAYISSTGGYTSEQFTQFFETGEIPDPKVEKILVVDKNEADVIHVLNIYNEYGVDVSDKFKERGANWYRVEDETWLNLNDGKPFVFTAQVVPGIEELDDYMLNMILPVMIEGVKFYVANTMQSGADSQVANYFYMRYYNRKKDLRNLVPNIAYTTQNETKDKRWL
jgi:hypothetical protein